MAVSDTRGSPADITVTLIVESDTSRSRGSGFRPEIQALRALAVALVIVYHAWPDVLPGGFVGVDVFFVISGFLITGHLWSEVERDGTVRLGRFWARRIRRLLPAASVVLGASFLAMLALVPRPVWPQTVWEIGASAAYVQNWVLSIASVDYLDADATPSLVQHYWSLSVEEQFYLVWPLLALAVAAVGRTRRRRVAIAGLAAVLAASLVWSVARTGDPSAYFDTAGRAWEFAAGGLLALTPGLLERMRRGARRAAVLSWAGSALVVGSALAFSHETPFPSATAAAPVLGTMLLLGAGMPRRSPSALAGARVLQRGGDLSYALYLWHWPLLAVLPFLFDRRVPWWAPALAVAATVVLAVLTNRLVETPLRRSALLTPRRAYGLAASAAATLVIAGLVTWGALSGATTAYADRAESAVSGDRCFGAAALAEPGCDDAFDATDVDTVHASQDRGVLEDDCNAEGREVVECSWGEETDPALTVALVGNSHAAHLVAAVREYGEPRDWRVLLLRKTDCLGVSSATLFDSHGAGGDDCLAWSGAVHERLASGDVDVALFASHRHALEYLAPAGADDAQAARLQSSIRSGFQHLEASGVRVLVTGDVPGTRPVPAPECVDLSASRDDPCRREIPGDGLDDGNVVMRAARSLPEVETLSLLPYVCSDGRCHSVIGDTVVYFDDHHLTATFSRTLAPYLGEAVRRTAGVR